jgi:hypothetical protein
MRFDCQGTLAGKSRAEKARRASLLRLFQSQEWETTIPLLR